MQHALLLMPPLLCAAPHWGHGLSLAYSAAYLLAWITAGIYLLTWAMLFLFRKSFSQPATRGGQLLLTMLLSALQACLMLMQAMIALVQHGCVRFCCSGVPCALETAHAICQREWQSC